MSSSRNAAELAVAEMRATLENQSTRLTQLVSEIRGLSLNSVLVSELITIPGDGAVSRDVSTPFASVGVWAYGASVTIDAGGEAAAAPAGGIGVIKVPGRCAIVWPLVGTTLAIYGTPGDQLLLALWSKPQCPLVATIPAVV